MKKMILFLGLPILTLADISITDIQLKELCNIGFSKTCVDILSEKYKNNKINMQIWELDTLERYSQFDEKNIDMSISIRREIIDILSEKYEKNKNNLQEYELEILIRHLSNGNNAEMSFAANIQAEIQDKKLDEAYKKALNFCDETYNGYENNIIKDCKKELEELQKAWLIFRDKRANVATYKDGIAGTTSMSMYYSTERELLTNQYISFLEEFYGKYNDAEICGQ